MLRDMVSVHTSSTWRTLTLTLTQTHMITAYSASRMSYVCAYSSVQLDKSRVEKVYLLSVVVDLICRNLSVVDVLGDDAPKKK